MGDGTRRMSGGKSNTRGTPQGGVASPLLANIYMNRFLKHWRLTGCGEAFRAHVVAYADDFVILSRGHAAEALAWTKAVMTRLGLTLNEAKTSLKNARQERFDFLGYTFGPHRYQREWPLVSGREPIQEERATAQDKGRRICWCPATMDPWPEVRDRLNRLTARLVHVTSPTGLVGRPIRSVDQYVYDRVRDFLARRHKVQGRGTRRFSLSCLRGTRRAVPRSACSDRPVVCLTVKPVGKPDAGNRHVRFDERGGETERCQRPQATAPVLDSTVASLSATHKLGRFRRRSGHGADTANRSLLT